MTATCARSITFTIPGVPGKPGTQVHVVENAGNLVFTVDVLDTAGMTGDLRGLFFHIDESVLPGLRIVDADPVITGTKIGTNDVTSLSPSVNMNGAVKGGFDVGLEFGYEGIGKGHYDVSGPVSFTLDATQDLTLDALTHMQFGARLTSIGDLVGPRNGSSKDVFVAPAAPDAKDDAYDIFEDGQSDLSHPSQVPQGVLFGVLANDTDADGDALTITGVHGATHGATEIVDGADADLLPGDAILYTPFADYAGADVFEYCISDNSGGTDLAQAEVAIAAVADVPALSYEILAGSVVNQVILRVTASQTDADSSEYIDRIDLSGIPDGVTIDVDGIDPVGEPDQIVQDFVLTLPLDRDTSFDLGITAFSKETSNADEESASASIPIVLETNEISAARTFQATDQSIWTSGSEFVFDDDRFLGINTQDSGGGGGLIARDWSYAFKAGFQSDLHFEGGSFDAAIPWQFDFETIYNKTTDVLVIDTAAAISPGGYFQTDGPSLDYALDFIFDYKVYLDVDLEVDLLIGSYDEDLFSINSAKNYSKSIIDYDSETSAPIDFTLPAPLDCISVELAWPNLEVSGTETSSGIYKGNGASNNALQLDLDVDQALANIFFGGVNPFDFGVNLGIVGGTIQLLDADVLAGLNFLQNFMLDAGTIVPTLYWEDGSTSSFNFGDKLVFGNAKSIDAAGDQDGLVEFSVGLNMVGSTLTNDTDLGFNVGWNLDLFQGTWWYDIEIYSDSGRWGPVVNLGQNQIPVAELDVFSDTIDVAFIGVSSIDLYA